MSTPAARVRHTVCQLSKLTATISVPVYLSWRAPPLLPQVQARVMVGLSAWDRKRTILPLLVPGFKNGQ